MDWLLGSDGNEWVWVMGEHKDDKTIEQIMEEEAIRKAAEQARKEAEALRYTDILNNCYLGFPSLILPNCDEKCTGSRGYL